MTPMLRPGIQRWLEQHCESSPQVAGGVVVASGAAGAGVGDAVDTVAEWPAGSQLTRPLAAAAQAALQRARPVVLAPTLGLADAQHNRVISLPLRAGDRLLGAVALAVQAGDTQVVDSLVRELTRASAGLGLSLEAARGVAPSYGVAAPGRAAAAAAGPAAGPAGPAAQARPAAGSTARAGNEIVGAGDDVAVASRTDTRATGLRRVLALGTAAAAAAAGPRGVTAAADGSASDAVEAAANAVDDGLTGFKAPAVGAPARAAPASAGQLAQAVELQALLLAAPTLADGALALLTELVPVLGGERATLAVVDGRELEVVAVSNSADWKAEQTLLRQIVAAMHESLDQGARVSHPGAAGDTLRIVLAHAALCAATGHAVVSLPLWAGGGADAVASAGGPVGALLVERRGNAPFDAEQLALCDALATLIGPLVDLRRRAERPWRARLAARWQAAVARLRRPDDPAPKVVAAALLAVGGGALAVAALLPLPYRIGAPVRVEGAVQRVVAAPIDGFLGRVLVRPGDSVRAGDLLVELADTDLLLEQRRWESALAQHDNGVAASLARADRAQFVVSQGRASEARAQLELVRQQLGRTRLLAPMDGQVIKGDLSQTLGAPVQRGDALLTLAPLQQFRLIVEVDERDIAAVRAGQSGRLALAAMPVDTLAFTVQRVTPVAVQRDGRNAFEVEGRLTTAATALRPGLEGVARIDVGRRPLAWQWSHRAIEWGRMAWWSL